MTTKSQQTSAGTRSAGLPSVDPIVRQVSPFALEHVTLVACDGSDATYPDRTVIVGASGMIEDVGASSSLNHSVPAGYRRVSGAGRYLIPGLVNLHAHGFDDGRPRIVHSPALRSIRERLHTDRHRRKRLAYMSAESMFTELASGVTTVRTVGDMGYEMVELRDSVNTGHVVGPRILASGPTLGGPLAERITLTGVTVDEVRENCRRNIEAGVNVLSVALTADADGDIDVSGLSHVEMDESVVRVICDEAHRRSIPVAARAQSAEAVHTALLAGVDTIEHGADFGADCNELFWRNPRSLRGWSALVPMVLEAEAYASLPPDALGQSETAHSNAVMMRNGVLDAVRGAALADVPIGVGTDAGMEYMPHYGIWRELDAMVRFGGLTRAQALHCATGQGARILGLESVTGSIEPGKYADMVMLRGNPLRHLRDLENPVLIVSRGSMLWRPTVRRYADLDRSLNTL